MKETLIAIAIVGLASCHSATSSLAPSVVRTERGEIKCLRTGPASGTRHRMILAHGFLRNATTMQHLATALADHGVETICPNLRHSRPWAGHADENALDLVALRKALGWERVIYAGFSAGGLSAVLAAAEDPAACEALLLLDPVDHESAGLRAAGNIRAPALALLAEPGPGNANGNAVPMLDAIAYCQTVRIPGASHCDFEAKPPAACYFLTRGNMIPQRIHDVHAGMVDAAKRLLDD